MTRLACNRRNGVSRHVRSHTLDHSHLSHGMGQAPDDGVAAPADMAAYFRLTEERIRIRDRRPIGKRKEQWQLPRNRWFEMS